VSTVLTRFVVPCLYVIIKQPQERRAPAA
jgi:hypothetical protein